MTTVYTFGGHGSRVIQPGHTFTPGVGITQNAGGGDTGDTGGGGSTTPVFDTVTYSEEIQSIIDNTSYTPPESVTLWDSPNTSNIQETFHPLPSLNNVTTMDQVLSAIDIGESSEFVVSNSTVGDTMAGGYGAVVVPADYGALYPNTSVYIWENGNGTLQLNQSITPVVLIDNDTFLGIMSKGTYPTFELRDGSWNLVGNQDDISTYNITLTAYTASSAQNDKYNLQPDSSLFPDNPSDGDRYLFIWNYNSSVGSVMYKYSAQESVAATFYDNSTGQNVAVDPSRLFYIADAFDSTSNPSDNGHVEGDIILTDYYPSMSYFNYTYEVRAGAYIQTYDYQSTYFAQGWNRDNDLNPNNAYLNQATSNYSISLDMTEGSVTSVSIYYGTIQAYINANDTVAKVISDLTSSVNMYYSAEYQLVIFKLAD